VEETLTKPSSPKTPRTLLLSMLDRKLLRELTEARGQNLAIATVVASGVAVLVMSLSVLAFLQSTRDAYYDRYRMADVFATLVRAPLPIAERLRMIPGVARLEQRIVTDVTLDVPGVVEPAVGRLISLPEPGRDGLNRVHLVRGRWPARQRFGEAVVSEAFFEANRLELGDAIRAIINGRLQPLRIVGVGLSPEYVFSLRGDEILPDDRRFGVFWMGRQGLEAAMDMEGAFNNVTLQLLRGANQEEVIDRLDEILEPYGGVGAYGREDQISAKFLDDEIRQLRATGLVAPLIFFGVAAFLLNVVVTRKIRGDRAAIAALRAFGYGRGEIAAHYLKSALVVTLAGAIAGAALGHWMGSGLADLYAEFYRFPSHAFRPDLRVLLPAVALSSLAAVLGTFRAVRDVVRLQPADAMRPPVPPRFGRSLVEQLGLGFLLPLTGRMILRQLGRRLVASALATVGIASAVSVMVMASFAPDALDYLLHFQFQLAQRQQLQVVLKDPRAADVLFELEKLPGVLRVEPLRVVAVELEHEHHQFRTGILGLGDTRALYRLLDAEGRPIRLPPSGIVLSDQLAKNLHVRAGETIDVHVLEGERPSLRLPVTGVVRELIGTNAYMRLPNLHRVMREGGVVSGAFLMVDRRDSAELYRRLKQTPGVASVAIKEKAIESFEETVSQNTLQMQAFTLFFAVVIAVGVVYNTARVSLDERAREFATMRVIGFTRGEVSFMMLGELGILTLVAIPLGWLIGYGFCYAMVTAFASDNFRIPLVLERSSYARAAIVTIAAAAASGLLVRRRLDRLDLIEVLKSR
jgi:putative ABC transport system permease protein